MEVGQSRVLASSQKDTSDLYVGDDLSKMSRKLSLDIENPFPGSQSTQYGVYNNYYSGMSGMENGNTAQNSQNENQNTPLINKLLPIISLVSEDLIDLQKPKPMDHDSLTQEKNLNNNPNVHTSP